MPQQLVVNEWLLHDLKGDNGTGLQKRAIKFLEGICSNKDLLVVVRGGSWMNKAYQLFTESDPHLRVISKYLHNAIIRNQNVCRMYDHDELMILPEDIHKIVPYDDVYLVRLYMTANADVLITADLRLRAALCVRPEIRVEMRDNFISNYLDEA